MKDPKYEIVSMIPSGRREKWSSFYADNFYPLWSDGKVGDHTTRHTPTPTQLNEIRANIPLAIKTCEGYIKELKRAKRVLSNPKHKKAQVRMAKLIEIEKYEQEANREMESKVA